MPDERATSEGGPWEVRSECLMRGYHTVYAVVNRDTGLTHFSRAGLWAHPTEGWANIVADALNDEWRAAREREEGKDA